MKKQKVMTLLLTAFLSLFIVSTGIAQTNLALNKTAAASSIEADFTPQSAIDGNMNTRWSSDFSDPQWIYVDLGAAYTINRVVLYWETAYGSSYQIQVSSNASTWTAVYTTTSGNGGTDDISFGSASARYVRMYGTARGTGWGYSLWEFEVYGSTAATAAPTNTPQPTNTQTPTPVVTNITLTDITDTAGTVSAQYTDSPSGEDITKLTDNNTSTKYLTFHASGWVQFQQSTTSVITRYTMTSANDVPDRDPYSWTLQGSANGSTWATLDSRSGEDFPNRFQTREFTFSNSTAYSYYRLNMNNNTGTILQIAEWELYGVTGGTVPTNTPTRTPTPTFTTAVTNTPTRTTAVTNTPTRTSAVTNTPTRTPTPTNTPTPGTTVNLAVGRPGTSSSTEAGLPPEGAFDGNMGTRWGSDFSDPQWIYCDLGATYTVSRVVLYWETAYGSAYQIQVSSNASSWTTVYSTTAGNGGTDDISFTAASARYVRMYGTARGTAWGYSLWEFEIYGTGSGPTPTPTPTNGGNDTEPPSPPQNLTANPAVYAVTLSWQHATDNVGIGSYRIYLSGNLVQTVDGASTSQTVSGLNPGTQYTFVVRAVDTSGNESADASVTTRTLTVATPTPGPGGGVIGIGNLASKMPAYASSGDPSLAVDANLNSRWESAFSDPQWIYVDLGLKYSLGRVILHWETASASNYEIQVSDDGASWSTAYVFNQSGLPLEPRTDDLTISAAGRYVRMYGTGRNSDWGYSLWEFELYSPGYGPGSAPDPNPNPNPPPVPPGAASFNVNSPANGAMVTNTRRPTLSWNGVSANYYEVWLNITRTDYDFTQWGSLLDRFTKMAEVSGTTYTLTQDLPDRWTYKWYVVAVNGSARSYSNLGIFSVYLPAVEQVADGINLINGCRDLNRNGVIETYEDWRQPVTSRVNDLMSRMTLEEKAYQMFYNAQAYPKSGWAFGPGSVDDMFNKQKASAATRLGIPFVSAGDCIHGYATTYPTQSALAATRNLDLIRRVGDIQRREQVAVGFRGTLAPLAEVATKVLYPRIQEGCGEDAEFAAAIVRALVCGLQGGPELNPGSVMVTTKHWPGEGAGGEAGIVYDAVSIVYHMKPWFANIDAGGGGVMPGYAGSSYLDPGGEGAGNSAPILQYLRDTVKFNGVICTDWLPWGAWVDAAQAGADVMGGADPGAVGFSMATFMNEVGETRINDAVRKILDTKFRLGVFEDPYGDPVNGPNTWFTTDSYNTVIDAARQCMTLLKNNNGTLPLRPGSGSNIIVAGDRAEDGESHSVWTSYFHDEYGALNMYQAITQRAAQNGANVYLNDASNPGAAIVIVGEKSYTHGTYWDINQDYLPADQVDLIRSYKNRGIPTIAVIIMPRPYVIADVLDIADAVVIAYRPGDGGGPGLAQVLFGDYTPRGKLPWQLPRSMDQVGTDTPTNQLEKWDLPFDLGATAAERQEIRNKIANHEPVLPIYGDPLFQYGDGMQGY
ncbi:MAG: discoidin domain-containing protein [Spirochaetales bacterium]|nr:discoidin domain-containing protein [Spirochaetales bacterium]